MVSDYEKCGFRKFLGYKLMFTGLKAIVRGTVPVKIRYIRRQARKELLLLEMVLMLTIHVMAIIYK